MFISLLLMFTTELVLV
ncbi:hypothetical protein RDI58_009224 [Solanum bulbocastanum]|uniref:Uncharacterized protein n=1 Tax=Solanum bulbocastanum TaxID=147425 RepID=A0AAN8TZR4_SOLBU